MPSETEPETVRDFLDRINNEIRNRFFKLPKVKELMEITALLDPRFKSLPFLPEAEVKRVHNRVRNEFGISPPSNTFSGMYGH